MVARGSIPESLKDNSLDELWHRVRQKLDKYGEERRGAVKLPSLTDHAALTLSSLLNKPTGSRIDLTELELALLAQGVGTDLHTALELLGVPASSTRIASRLATQRREEARCRVIEMVATWPEAWCGEWVDWLFRSGAMAHTDAASATERVSEVRRLLDHCSVLNAPMARNDLAVSLYGSAHALDDGSTRERCARRALWHVLTQTPDYHQGRAVWNAAGIYTDKVSTPVLTWQLHLQAGSALGTLCSAANKAGIPLHLSLFALLANPVLCDNPDRSVLVVENPRLVEAAAELGFEQTVIATNGNPSTVVLLLVQSMLEQGIEVLYHGDFDAAGLAICSRMVEKGCTPWRMTASDYGGALEKAKKLGVQLPMDYMPCGATAWDVELQRAMLLHQRVVHEEFLIEVLLR